jgi:hypothetical protein
VCDRGGVCLPLKETANGLLKQVLFSLLFDKTRKSAWIALQLPCFGRVWSQMRANKAKPWRFGQIYSAENARIIAKNFEETLLETRIEMDFAPRIAPVNHRESLPLPHSGQD